MDRESKDTDASERKERQRDTSAMVGDVSEGRRGDREARSKAAAEDSSPAWDVRQLRLTEVCRGSADARGPSFAATPPSGKCILTDLCVHATALV